MNKRAALWSKIIIGYENMDSETRPKARQSFIKWQGLPKFKYLSKDTLETYIKTGVTFMYDDCLDCCPTESMKAQPACCTSYKVKATIAHPTMGGPMPEKKENNMAYDTTLAVANNIELDQRKHLKSRLETVKESKKSELKKQFHIKSDYEDYCPKTEAELRDAFDRALKAMPAYATNKNGEYIGNPMHYIRIEDPKTDKAGYESAKKLLDAKFTEAKDAIIILPVTEGLAALKQFETFQA